MTHILLRRAYLSLSGMVICMLLSGCNRGPETLAVIEQPTSGGLVCDSPAWEMGELLVKGETVKFHHTFVLKNQSDKEIRIREVSSDCGCVVTEGYDKVIAPGAKSDINVTIAVFGPPGRFGKTLVVREDADVPQLMRLSITGTRAVSSLLASSPATVDFGKIVKGESKTKSVFVTRYDGTKIGFRDLLTDGESVTLDGQPTSSSRTSPLGQPVDCVELPIRLNSESLTSGPFGSVLTVLTDSVDPSTSELKISVIGVIQEQDSLFVESIFVERLEIGASVICKLFNERSDGAGKVRELSYEGDDRLDVDLVQADGLSCVKVTRTGTAEASGLARGKLKLSTDGVDEAMIAISAFLPK